MGQAEAQNQPFRLSGALPSLGGQASQPAHLPLLIDHVTYTDGSIMELGRLNGCKGLASPQELLSPLSSGHKGWGAGRMEGVGASADGRAGVEG